MKKYQTEEERKQAKREYDKQRYQTNREKRLEQNKQWYEANKEKKVEYLKQYRQDNKEKILEQQKQYNQVNKEKIAEQKRQYYQVNRKKILEQKKQYRKDNAERIADYNKQYFKTPMGRAKCLVSSHKQADIKMGRGECTLTPQWIINHIFTSKCIYCGESDWHKLGCDRIDNSLPHTEDNVVPCCEACNKKRGLKPFEDFLAECE